MGNKRKEREAASDDDAPAKSRTKNMDGGKPQLLPSMIKNKDKRSALYAKLKHEKKAEKRKNAKAREALESRALELGEELPPKKVPRTIENTREADETICRPDDEELFAGNDAHSPSTTSTPYGGRSVIRRLHLCIRRGWSFLWWRWWIWSCAAQERRMSLRRCIVAMVDMVVGYIGFVTVSIDETIVLFVESTYTSAGSDCLEYQKANYPALQSEILMTMAGCEEGYSSGGYELIPGTIK